MNGDLEYKLPRWGLGVLSTFEPMIADLRQYRDLLGVLWHNSVGIFIRGNSLSRDSVRCNIRQVAPENANRGEEHLNQPQPRNTTDPSVQENHTYFENLVREAN